MYRNNNSAECFNIDDGEADEGDEDDLEDAEGEIAESDDEVTALEKDTLNVLKKVKGPQAKLPKSLSPRTETKRHRRLNRRTLKAKPKAPTSLFSSRHLRGPLQSLLMISSSKTRAASLRLRTRMSLPRKSSTLKAKMRWNWYSRTRMVSRLTR